MYKASSIKAKNLVVFYVIFIKNDIKNVKKMAAVENTEKEVHMLIVNADYK